MSGSTVSSSRSITPPASVLANAGFVQEQKNLPGLMGVAARKREV